MKRTHLALMCLLLTIAGCSNPTTLPIPKTYPVKGKVTFTDGTPVPTAALRLTNADARLSTAGVTKADGTFELKTFTDDQTTPGALEGEHALDISGGPLEDNRPIALRIVRPTKIKVEAGENEVTIEVERVGR